jgi:hypothetical protein
MHRFSSTHEHHPLFASIHPCCSASVTKATTRLTLRGEQRLHVAVRRLVSPLRAFTLTIVLTLSLFADLTAADPKWHDLVAPNKRYAVRLREGYAIGNCRYDDAQLIDTKTGTMLFDFGPEHDPSFDLGGYEEDSVVWSPNSQSVAVYFHSHRVGAPLVVRISGDTALACTVPEMTLPHDKDSANGGRHVQDWFKPIKWLSDSTLPLTESGLIQQQREDGFTIVYSYDIQFQFDRKGDGVLKSLKQREFSKARSE